MEFRQIKGNTWVFHAAELIPVYLLGNGNCVIFDSGFPDEREKLEKALKEQNLTPKAVFCSHAHIDHIGSGAYFQEKYNIPLYMSQGEAGVLCHILNMKTYRITVSPQEAEDLMSDCISKNISVITEDTKFVEVEGAKFPIYFTSGHSSQHICISTPDNVCYLGDALLTRDQLTAKLPYALDIAKTLESHKKLLDFPEEIYIMAHFGTCEKKDMTALVKDNQDLFLQRAQDIRHCAGRGKTIDQLTIDFCKHHQLNTRKAKRITHYQRNIRFFLEFLEDIGDITMEMSEYGILYRNTLILD